MWDVWFHSQIIYSKIQLPCLLLIRSKTPQLAILASGLLPSWANNNAGQQGQQQQQQPQQAQVPGQAGHQGASGLHGPPGLAGAGGPSTNQDSERIRLVTRQLVLLLHAHRCSKRVRMQCIVVELFNL